MLYVDSGEPVAAKSGVEIAPGRSASLAAWRVLDAPLELRTRDFRYAYRAISSKEEGFNAVWGVQSVLDVHPDLRISLKGWWGYGFTFKPAKAQPEGWPLQPLSRTCP